MKIKNKIFLGAFFGILCILLLLTLFGSRKEPSVSAQGENPYLYSTLVCDEPIPIGEAMEETTLLMNDVYREFQSSRGYIISAIEQIQSEISDLYRDSDKICNYSVCQPLVVDQAPDLEIKVSYLIGESTLAGIHIPFCLAKECVGEPCPDLEDSLKTLAALRDGLKGSYEIIKDIFYSKETPLTEEIRIKTGLNKENISEKIRRPEMVKRKLQLVREWLHASTETGKRSCSLTESERKKVANGEMGNRYPTRCTEALSAGYYWPKMWSENCQTECGEKGDMEKCVSCLGNSNKKGTSALSQINYKIYGACQSSCQSGLNESCLGCICTNDKGEKLSETQCIAWICGGSYYNYVCCHETPLETN